MTKKELVFRRILRTMALYNTYRLFVHFIRGYYGNAQPFDKFLEEYNAVIYKWLYSTALCCTIFFAF